MVSLAVDCKFECIPIPRTVFTPYVHRNKAVENHNGHFTNKADCWNDINCAKPLSTSEGPTTKCRPFSCELGFNGGSKWNNWKLRSQLLPDCKVVSIVQMKRDEQLLQNLRS
ncbi:hypothetical protein RchiOBHm_Chr1g0313871 [Rosa chinensis]|uniref:Uncharacterized protein n=1 Tax=Rosa chinensis TaxID=74649 RepID=A0A2P6S6Z2_ROSCH|nr:hypothetical protein RchiOBHm_Chr1g0313871 [Rosa chinensis]